MRRTSLRRAALASAAWLSLAGAGDLPRAVPVGPPASWFSGDDYPAEAVRSRVEGVVSYRLLVGPDGHATRCDVVQSSGSTVLDDGTCQLLMRRAKFAATTDRTSAAEYTGKAAWRLPPGKAVVPQPKRDLVIANVDGRLRCTVTWDGSPRVLEDEVCRTIASHLSPSVRYPVKLQIIAMATELGLNGPPA